MASFNKWTQLREQNSADMLQEKSSVNFRKKSLVLRENNVNRLDQSKLGISQGIVIVYAQHKKS